MSWGSFTFKSNYFFSILGAHEDVDITAEIYEPWLIANDEENAKEDVDEKVVIDYGEDGGVVDHGDHVHDTRYDTEVESVR